MKIYVDKVEKCNMHPVNGRHRVPRRSGKKGNLNRRRMSNYNNTFLPCGGVYPHKVKWPAGSKVCNKYKEITYRNYYTRYCKTKLTQKWITTRTIADKICILDKL